MKRFNNVNTFMNWAIYFVTFLTIACNSDNSKSYAAQSSAKQIAENEPISFENELNKPQQPKKTENKQISKVEDIQIKESVNQKNILGIWECNVGATYAFYENGIGKLILKIRPDKYRDPNSRIIVPPAPNSGCTCTVPIKWSLKKNMITIYNGVSNCECKGLDKHKEEQDINHEGLEGIVKFQNENIMYIDDLKFKRIGNDIKENGESDGG